ncbi:MAG: hypothetical protein Q8P18_16275 [Pseudomonadota bacterium]|nr:hypothetical protein [Pseudomonadota bacterium]
MDEPAFVPFRRTLRGAAFTPAAAAAVSRGGAIPGLELHPWIVAQLRERTGIGPGGRPPAWTISRVRAMDTAALEATLARLGVPVDRGTFAEAAEEHLSAWDLSVEWTPVAGADAELLGLVACELWRRWLPDFPSLEMVDERMQDGYDALDRADARGACTIWLEVWGLLLDILPEARSSTELDEGFAAGLNRIGNWVGDVSIELLNLVREEPKLARRARDVYCAAAERLGDVHVRQDLAELHYSLGEAGAGEAVLEALIRDDPDDLAGYARLSDHLGWPSHGGYTDVPRAIALLELALARPVREPVRWDLPKRLADLRERRGVD